VATPIERANDNNNNGQEGGNNEGGSHNAGQGGGCGYGFIMMEEETIMAKEMETKMAMTNLEEDSMVGREGIGLFSFGALGHEW
jgi:hypothetical protein